VRVCVYVWATLPDLNKMEWNGMATSRDCAVAVKPRDACNVLFVLNSCSVYLLTEAVRLAGSGLDNAGRLEINYGGIWGTVSHDNFDDDDAKVACYMLGFGYVRLTVNSHSSKCVQIID